MYLTGEDIRREYNLVMNALSEKFVKENDATMAVGEFLEDASLSISTIQSLYNGHANNREMIIQPVLRELKDLRDFVDRAEGLLKKHVNGRAEPEDNNTEVGY